MYLTGFQSLRGSNGNTNVGSTGVMVVHGSYITIGQPGKGNYFEHNTQALHARANTLGRSSHITFQSNLVGTINTNGDFQPSGVGVDADDVLIGGDSPQEGNRILGSFALIGNNTRFSHNILNIDISGTPIFQSQSLLNLTCYLNFANNAKVTQNQWPAISISIDNVQNFEVSGNITTAQPGQSNINIDNSQNGLIGGIDAATANLLRKTLITSATSKNIRILRNSIQCVTAPYTIQNPQSTIPQINILVNTDSELSGKASPLSNIYIYEDNSGCSVCNPVTFLQTVTAGTDGKWTYTGNFTGKNLVANATLMDNSSEFAIPQPIIDPASIANPDCGQTNGAAKVVSMGNFTNIAWYRDDGSFVMDGLYLSGVGPGSYYAKGVNGDCSAKSETITLTGGDLQISIDGLTKTPATCNNPDGSITGILVTGTGTITYKWVNETGQVFLGNADLLNVPPGKYKLIVNNGICPEIKTDAIEVLSNGVNLNTDNIQVLSQTACKPGSITGLTSPDATTFKWIRKADNAVVGQSLDLLDAVAGDYELTISNANCVRTFDFSVAYLPPVPFQPFPAQTFKSCGDFPSGKLVINTDGAPSQPIALRLVNEQGETKGNDKTVEYLPAGKYQLYVTDYTGCESLNTEYTIDAYPPFGLVKAGSFTPIFCGVGTTNITETIVSGGDGVYSYTWFKDGVEIPGEHNPYLNNIGVGNYKLLITDGQGCLYLPFPFEVKNETNIPPTPLVNDIEMNSKGNVTLAVQNPYPAAIYKLYDIENSDNAISESIGGDFTINVTETRTYWVRLFYGECKSEPAKATITLGLITDAIPNAFSPNGDGINDYWAIKGIEDSGLFTVKVFSRQGQMVFQSRGYAKPFDGTYGGKLLPTGVYYYIIETQNSKPLSGHVTIIR